MHLHFPTLGLVLLTVGILSSTIMIIIWRMYRQEPGTGLLACAAVLSVFGFLPMWVEPQIGPLAIVISNIATVGTPLLIFEGMVRFRRLSLAERLRIPVLFLYFMAYMAWTLTHLEHTRERFLANDLMMVILLGATIALLLWRQQGMERRVYMVIASTFALMLLAFSYRWIFTLTHTAENGSYRDSLTTLIIITLVPWAFGWTYGFVLVINIKGRQALHDAARRDPLTGLHNRLWMKERFDSAPSSTGRADGTPFCLVIIDINGFKRINDERGHLFGDLVLMQTARMIAGRLDPEDAAIRYGGDEFILLLTCKGNHMDLQSKLETIMREFKAPVVVEEVPIKISLSYGNANYPKDGTTLDELFKIADQRMYEQKRLLAR